LSALAARKLAASGVPLEPGEMIQYVVAHEHDPVKDWRVTPLAFIDDAFEYDREYYGKLLDRATQITPFNFSRPTFKESRRSRKMKPNPQLWLPGINLIGSS
jgi:DNA polymerase elongation subunit (family B)